MHTIRLVASLLIAAALAAPQAFATVNYGDFIGTGVDFLQVSEETQTAGDPEPLWGAPTLAGAGDQLLFTPAAYISSCASGGSDVTTSILSTTISAQGTNTIDNLALAENGDVTLTAFPPPGNPTTNASAGLSGTVTVIEDGSGPIAPVVIPFSGTFSPSPTFSLPASFGTNTWSGTIAIDIASVVPDAKKVELALDNTLDSNCGPGNTSAKIQKKVVSGPSVAIMVNPIECALELEKTCCVTQPALPDLGVCEGDLISLDLEYTGDKCHASNNDQGKAFRCHGRRRLGEPADVFVLNHSGDIQATPNTGVNKGDVVQITSTTGTLENKLKLKTKDDWWRRQYLKIDTSCERAIQCGDQFGAYKVVGFESTLGGVADCDAPPPPPVCATSGDPVGTPCDAKVVDMVLEYTGQPCQSPLANPQNGEASCSGDATGATDVGIVYTGHHGYKQQVSPASNINDGDRIRVTATWRGGLFPNQSYLITDDSGVLQEVAFHTSCSQPLALGDEFGSLKLVEFTTKNRTQAALGDGNDGPADACQVPLMPPGPHCTSDLQELTLVYIGDYLEEGCTVSNDQSGYASCSGVDDPGDPVSVAVGSGLTVEPVEFIEFGDRVSITATSGGDLPSFVSLETTGSGGVQDITLKASCHKPLSLGDRFGAWVVFAMDREDDGPVSLGGNVQYQYTVTNPNDLTVDNVDVEDSELGEIASGLSLAPGESQTFAVGATLFGTTTNDATATGDILGDLCDPGEDSLTVDVVVPPQGSFNCSCWQSLTEVTLIWDGTETVDIQAWDGQPGSTALQSFDDVAPGDSITITGFTADEAILEIFDSTGATKLDESELHLTCRDKAMNGVEDCGKRQGDGKYNDPSKRNDWILDGMVDDDETLSCSPVVVGPPPSCGFGPELMLALPGLLWLHRRRLLKG
ncbi:MAG: DUF7467 domain-containing protein [Myxococcota bacterium]